MANVEISKRVLYSGVWQSQVVNDQVLHQIGAQNAMKKKKALKGSPSVLKLAEDKLDLLIYDTTGKLVRNDQIPLTDIVEITANMKDATSIFAVVRDNIHKNYYIFMFLCASDRDAAEILQGFGRVRQRLSGEGYNTDIKPAGNNWTLQEKEDNIAPQKSQNGHMTVIETKSTPNGNVTVISPERQTEARILTTTTQSVQSPNVNQEIVVSDPDMRYELHHLADEVRDIKLMLRKSQGRHNFEKHYRHLLGPSATGGQTKSHLTTTRTTTSTTRKPQGYVVAEQRPTDTETRIRTETVRMAQPAPVVRRYRSKGSTTSSIRSGYTKSVYDSPNPYAEQQPRVISQHYVKTVQQGQKPQGVFMSYPSNTVTKNIEDVYKSRSLRMRYAPQARVAPQFVQVNTSQKPPSVVVNQSDAMVKEYIEDRQNAANVEKPTYEPEIRHVYENEDFRNDVVVVEKVTDVRRAPVVISERPTIIQRTYETNNVDGIDENVVVIRADTNVYKSMETTPSNGETTIYNNKVYHIKSEGVVDSDGGGETVHYTAVETDRPAASSGDGLWESYANQPDENAGDETLEKVEAYRYHDNEDEDANNGEIGEKREEKRVHYMTELEQTINDRQEGVDDDDENAEREVNDIVDGKLGGDADDDNDDYVLNEEELEMFRTEPNLVVIDKDD